MKAHFEEPPQEEEESYTKDELLAWIGKGPGKGGKAKRGKGSKGTFQGNCNYCGVYGHRINECRKKDSDMKGKGKGRGFPQGFPQPPGWEAPNPSKGKG